MDLATGDDYVETTLKNWLKPYYLKVSFLLQMNEENKIQNWWPKAVTLHLSVSSIHLPADISKMKIGHYTVSQYLQVIGNSKIFKTSRSRKE